MVGFLPNRRFDVVHGNGKHFLGFDLRHTILENERKAAGDQIGNDDAAEKSSLKSMGDPFRGSLSEKAFVAEKRNQKDGNAHRHRIAQHHGPCGTLDELKGLRGILHIGQEDQDHMDHFAHHSNANAIAPGGFFVVKHQFPKSGGHKAGQNGCHTAGKPGIHTAAPVHREPAVKAADQTGNNTGRCAEDQARGQRRGIPHIYRRSQPLHAVAGCKSRNRTEKKTDNDLLCHIRHFFSRRMLSCQVYRQHQYAVK